MTVLLGLLAIAATPLAAQQPKTIRAIENNAGMAGLVQSDFAKSKALLKEAGYDGTPIVMLHTTDIAVLTNAGPIAKSPGCRST